MCRSSASGIPSVRRSFLLDVHLSHPVHLSLHSPVLSNIVSSFLTHFKSYFLFSFLAFLHDFSVFSFFPQLSAHCFTIFLITACPAAAQHSIVPAIAAGRPDEEDARSLAQGAAEKTAKLNCPPGVEILDNWVDYSMIDDEFVLATVVLVFEAPIGARHGAD